MVFVLSTILHKFHSANADTHVTTGNYPTIPRGSAAEGIRRLLQAPECPLGLLTLKGMHDDSAPPVFTHIPH